MEWLNYHHLYYFWTVVRLGGVVRASEELRLSPPTVSAQVRMLEEHLGEKLLVRTGRKLAPTEMGRIVYRYADEIFTLGQEMLDAVRQRPTGRPLHLAVGVDDVLPKEIARQLIEPALGMPQAVRILCREASLERLVADLAVHDLDVVLSDAPVTPTLNIRAFNHPLGECGVAWVGTPQLARAHRKQFPKSLEGAPVLLPTDDTAIRRGLDLWLQEKGLHPALVGEFEDFALLQAFGQTGAGIFPVASVLAPRLKSVYGIELVGPADGVTARFFAISMERKTKHPAVVAICETARRTLFAED